MLIATGVLQKAGADNMAGPTMTDLAKELGVSVSTVSRALRGDTRILPQTRQRVMEAADRLGYQLRVRHPTADDQPEATPPKAPEPEPRRVAAIVAGTALQEFYSPFFQALQSQGHMHGFTVTQVITTADTDFTAEVAETSPAYDALVLITWGQFEPAQARQLGQASCPVVCFNRHIPGLTYAVTLDDAGAGTQAANYLLGLGHHRIAHLPGPQWSSSLRERTASFRSILEVAGCYQPEYFAPPVTSRAELLEWAGAEVDRMLSLPSPPTALWAHTDVAASIAIVAALSKGLRVPEDLSVMGFDHTAELHEVGITTFRWPFAALAQQAALMIRLLLDEQIAEPLRYCVAARLVEGRTTGPAPA